uniref:Ribosome assembly factor mrt4 n=1 Tax=Xenopsylla cheopis TaxID=163159 RepID=A0A6M2DIZ4_XENCH
MPKSKRDKKISLTKTDKKGLALKQQIINDIRSCVEKYSTIYLFAVKNMRNTQLKDLRTEWNNSRFFFGKNKIMALGLGRNEQDEIEDNLHKLSAELQGQCGLLFTEKSKEEVVSWFNSFSAQEYARSGFVASETILLPEGPMEEFSHSIEPHLRQLGLPTSLKKGVVTLLKEHEVCRKGSILTPEQARILKLIGKPLAEFKLEIKCVWSKQDGFEMLSEGSTEEQQEMMDEDE